jgi:hypothetical protein
MLYIDANLEFYDSTNCFLQHKEAVIKGIKYFGEKTIDFVDCILAGYYEVENISIQTFDTKLDKFLSSIAKTKN